MDALHKQLRTISDTMRSLAERVKTLETQELVSPTVVIDATEEAMDDGSVVGTFMNKIIRIPFGFAAMEFYDKTSTGLFTALSVSVSGDVIVVPPCTLTGNFTVPPGAILYAWGSRTTIVGTLTLDVGAAIVRITVELDTSSSSVVVGVQGAASGINTLNDCHVSITNTGTGGVHAVKDGGGEILIWNSWIEGYATGGGNGYAVVQTSGTVSVTDDGRLQATTAKVNGSVNLISHDDLIKLHTSTTILVYPADSVGLTAALAAALNGDSVQLPPGTITGTFTIPAGVEVFGSGSNTVLDAAITNNGKLSNLTVESTGSVTPLHTGMRSVYNEDLETFTIDQEADNLRFGTGAFKSGAGSGSHSIALGQFALQDAIGGSTDNIAIGQNALESVTTGDGNVGIGGNAGGAFTVGSSYNVAIGWNAGKQLSGARNRNVSVGAFSGGPTTGERVIAIGGSAAAGMTSATRSVVIGDTAGINLTTGSYNTVVGASTAGGITTGAENTIIGAQVAGLAAALSNTVILSDGAGDIRFYSNSAGDTGLNTAVPLAQVHIDQDDAAAAQPVLLLDQADVDESFTKYVGTGALADLTRSIVDVADVSTATVVGYIKVAVEDLGDQVVDGEYYLPVYSIV